MPSWRRFLVGAALALPLVARADGLPPGGDPALPAAPIQPAALEEKGPAPAPAATPLPAVKQPAPAADVTRLPSLPRPPPPVEPPRPALPPAAPGTPGVRLAWLG